MASLRATLLLSMSLSVGTAILVTACDDDATRATKARQIEAPTTSTLATSLPPTTAVRPQSSTGPREPPDTDRIAFGSDRDGDWDLYVMDSDGSHVASLTDNRAWDGGAAWSPDGSRIAFSSNRAGVDGDLYVMNADGTGATQLTDHPRDDFAPSWSPDGTRIAWHTDRNDNIEIYVMDADGSNVTRLTNHPAVDIAPVWAPQGAASAAARANTTATEPETRGVDRITFSSNREGNFEIYVMDADGSNLRRLTNDPGDDFAFSWSPDGSRIAFWSDRTDDNEVYVVDADGSNLMRLTDHPGNDVAPAWSPAGTRIVFVSDRDGDDELYVMNCDGSNVIQLTSNRAQDGYPDWLPAP